MSVFSRNLISNIVVRMRPSTIAKRTLRFVKAAGQRAKITEIGQGTKGVSPC